MTGDQMSLTNQWAAAARHTRREQASIARGTSATRPAIIKADPVGSRDVILAIIFAAV